MTNSSVESDLGIKDGCNLILIAADSRYDMVFEEATLMDFTIGGPLYGGKDLPMSMTVHVSSENVPEPDGCAYVAVALGLVVCALAILALVHHGRGPRRD